VTEANAMDQLVTLAEQLGAPVLAEQQTSHGRLPMPSDHDLYAGVLPLWSSDIHQQLTAFDVVLVVGMSLLRLYIYHEPACPIPDHIRLIHLDSNPWEIGKNYPVEIGLLGDPQAGLAELVHYVSDVQPADQVRAAARRREAYAARRAAERDTLLTAMNAQRDQRPMTPLTLMGTLSHVLPPDAVMVEEAATTHNNVLERLGVFKDPTSRIAHRGWALGWGVGCAIGVKLAWPERSVVALLGDGAALYGIQGLWTAAHHRIPVVFLIANNTQYQILKRASDVMSLSRLTQANYPAMDILGPEIDFVGLAHSLGVEAYRVTEPDELLERMRDSLERTKPVLLDIPIER
jgi:benzoylformate decarboxylase